jgi:prepilin peptidase CpaA
VIGQEALALGALIGVVALLMAAAISDIATMQIPNWISIAAAAAYPPLAIAAGQDVGAIFWHIACGAVIFAAGFFLFGLGVLGGGDVKVFAAAGVWTGFASLASFLAVTFITGGILALGMLILRRWITPGPTLPRFLNRLVDHARGVPYAVAIAVGGLTTALSWPIITTA